MLLFIPLLQKKMAIFTDRHFNQEILIIDNITWLTSKSESGDAAAQLMSRLITMKKRGG